MQDSFKREVNYLRLSITDKCNLRCKYCMAEDFNNFLKKDEVISLTDIENIVGMLTKLGITKVKLTGGEPLIRQDFPEIVKKLKRNENIKEITLTTNGVLLSQHIDLLKDNIDSINISLDTVNEQVFTDITKKKEFAATMESINLAVSNKLKNLKINTVPLKEYGPNNIYELVEYCNTNNLKVRFIEMMPIGLGKNNSSYSFAEVINILEQKYGAAKKIDIKYGNGPSVYYEFANLNIPVGFILAMSNKFCENCNKVRVTSNGYIKSCLHYKDNLNIKELATYQNENNLNILQDFIFNKPKEHKFLEENKEGKFEDSTMSFIGG